jgi:hypothetical protein
MTIEEPEAVPYNKPLVYFVQAREGDPIKIGRVSRAHLLPSRLASLQTGSPYPLHVLGVVRGDKEAELHRRFAAHRLSGEWFEAAWPILAFLGIPGKAAKSRRESADYDRGRKDGYEDGLRDGWVEAGQELQRFVSQHCFFEPEAWPAGGSRAAA